jgi:hypothetical protein
MEKAMKKPDFVFRTVVVTLVILIAVVFLFRFVIKKDRTMQVAIENPEKIDLITLENKTVTLDRLEKQSGYLYLAIFDYSDCYSCIVKGLNDLRALQGKGKNCAAIVLHEYIEEIRGWSANQDFSPFYMMRKSVFYEHIKTPHTPLFVCIKNGKIDSFRFITP